MDDPLQFGNDSQISVNKKSVNLYQSDKSDCNESSHPLQFGFSQLKKNNISSCILLFSISY